MISCGMICACMCGKYIIINDKCLEHVFDCNFFVTLLGIEMYSGIYLLIHV